jgi:GxxExxY protein
MLIGRDTQLTERIIGCGIEVHKHLGPGLSESVYESALCIELREANIPFTRQIGIPVYYKGVLISEYRPDLIAAERIVIEVKSVEHLGPIHTSQMLTYLKVSQLKTGLLLNFNTAVLRHGIRRVLL